LSEIAEERTRIARELHDGIAQDLAALGYALDSEIGRSDTLPESRSALRAIRGQVTDLNHKIREEIFRLRDNSDSTHELAASATSLGLDLVIDGALANDEVGAELKKVILELMRNSAEHSGSKNIKITVTADHIEINSDSNGEASNTPLASNQKSFGLIGVNERLSEIGWSGDFSDDFTHIELRKK
jgi:signal transduction histidine kinase